ncbi:M20/M25/M40 family metallo-hydrolase [Aquicella lusitana]|uniref:Glutamate carboxypeptidase n=1 Tax=Aquicella lusitana TaxID=254246 RepID=A0A370GGS9_9COXI|nr:M20/M25/M40 family metallo-hydrolase [Aquicella lusitana]RDI42540.1 glutamate carboxypeptidase [Aquicella lusitana]VVC74319.1 Carboxypeptidase G2 [Aquicella lusitana]
MRIFFWVILYFFTQTAVAAGPLSPVEEKMKNYIGEHKQSQIILLKKLVNINSGTMNIRGVHRVGGVVRAQLSQLGFETYWVEEPASMHRAGTLVAERRGNKGKRVLLIAHLDTVFPPTSKFKRFEMHKHSAKGPGVIDNKGGVVVILYALKALNAAHVLKDTTITVVLTGDEEDSGKPTSISRQPLIKVARRSDVALDFEPAISLETATIARRGISDWTVETAGNQSHSATIFQENVGAGAIFELTRILNAMREQLQNEKYLSFNPGIVLGGTHITYNKKTYDGTAFGKQNVVAQIAQADGDFRFIDETQKNLIKAKMAEIVEQHLPYTKAKISFQDGIPAMAPTENNRKLLEQYSEASLALGQGAIKPLDPGMRGAGDISHIAQIVPANLAGLGPAGWGAHSNAETVEIDSLPVQTQRAAILIYRLTH